MTSFASVSGTIELHREYHSERAAPKNHFMAAGQHLLPTTHIRYATLSIHYFSTLNF